HRVLRLLRRDLLRRTGDRRPGPARLRRRRLRRQHWRRRDRRPRRRRLAAVCDAATQGVSMSAEQFSEKPLPPSAKKPQCWRCGQRAWADSLSCWFCHEKNPLQKEPAKDPARESTSNDSFATVGVILLAVV